MKWTFEEAERLDKSELIQELVDVSSELFKKKAQLKEERKARKRWSELPKAIHAAISQIASGPDPTEEDFRRAISIAIAFSKPKKRIAK